MKWTRAAALFLTGLTGVACSSAFATPTRDGTWVLDVNNYSAGAVVVTPWVGGPKRTITCGNGVEFRDGSRGAPRLPWRVVVAVKPDGKIVLDQLAGAHGSPGQEVVVETDASGNAGAFMRNAGGSLSFPGPCPSP
ncbi:MAG TPA: hypothetical protein VND54_01600 [Candidatus Saccharimonadales bacterium]|nr:hypothetical protein [Candidatus Saccharimonadales bacterium]